MKCKFCGNTIPANSIFCNLCGERQIKERRKKDEVKIPAPRQLPSGKWRIELRAEGQSGTFDTQAEAEAWARAMRAGYVKLKSKPAAKTLRAAIDEYINSKSAVLSPATIAGYRVIQKNRFAHVMDSRICDIDNWQKIVNIEAQKVSAKTLRNSWCFVCAVLAANHVDAPNVTLPRVVNTEHAFLEPDQIIAFINEINGNDLEIPALLALHGLRRSEILAVDIREDIDVANGIIHVRGAAVPDEKGRLVYKSTNKTKASRRDVPIMIPALVEALNKSQRDGPAVTCHQNTLWRQINCVCQRAGLPPVGVHGLRHSFASLGYYLGISERQIMEWGGWSTPRTVNEIYTHLSKRARINAENDMKKFFKNAHDLRTKL